MSKDRTFSTAIHILAALDHQHPKLLSSDDLSKGLKTNPVLIRRILSKLSQAGLIESIKGKGGGNQLAKPATKVDLESVYLAVKDGPLFGSFDKEPFEACSVSCNLGKSLRAHIRTLKNT